MDAIALLVEQHNELDDLYKMIAQASHRRRKTEYFKEFADKLLAHAAIEETLFYPVVRNGSTEALILEAAEEHLLLRRLIADLVELDVDHRDFAIKCRVLKAQLQHHHREEEEQLLFPLVRRSVSGFILDELSDDMTEEFYFLLAQRPRETVHRHLAHAVSIL